MRIYHPISLVLFLGLQLAAASTDYQFDGEISRAVLENYLARSVTFAELLHGIGNVDDNIRFLKNTGAKFAGRAIYRWGGEAGLPQLLERARPIAEKVHQADPDIIIQAACFEIVTRQVNQLTVPDWVFKEFGLTPENRQFRYEAMLYPEGQWGRDHWGKGASVPDMSQLETRMWFFYLAASYIDVGVEGIHFGQVEIMDNRDPDHAYWSDLLERVRRYAAGHARRHLVLCDAHVPSGGIVRNGRLLFDFHSFPLRIDEVVEHPQEGVLKMGYLDSLFGRSKGGITPSGWKCDHLPFLVELDNFEPSGHEGQNIGAHWIWGYDEICWFARQSEAYRNQWLGYAWDWIRQHDTNAWLEMPGSRTLAVPVNGKHWYWANTASPAVPDGFNQEETIKRIWASTPPATSAADSSSLNWPQFRGPEGNGHAHAERLPLTWTETQNVVWKTPIHDLGWSSPVVWGNQVWVTTATEDGKQMFAVRVDRDTGKVVHDVKVFDTENPLHVASVNSYASPTPVIEAGRLYVHFGTYGTACLDTANGRILWTRRDLNCDHHEGPGSSPILDGDKLIFDVDGRDVQYVIALDKVTGKTVWKTKRSVDFSQVYYDCRKAFCTPTVIEAGGRRQLISPGAKAAMAYDPQTGQELWKVRYNGWSVTPRPVFGNGLVFLITDYEKPELWAVRPDGQGDITDTHVAWKITKEMPSTASLLFVDGLIYLVNDQGYVLCLEASTGQVVWRDRLKGKHSASPIYSAGRIYLISEKGIATVIEAGRQFKILAQNEFSERIMATPAVSGESLIVRTHSHLYRLENQE